ncbi:hypothetical protein [Actinoallomurus iriomotensis]|uniref:Uncharacterized protein n=1 Tax=Actinoallomurus iriomotensis TaxID=478107 RepID=A0A9W6RX94_9ACTN|nr:hypothetical protein [Actinoallomurus iriomotensis]GLY81807.1 hypothetical protein Airi01_100740 [Actinoallomurus iriomotensis]
MTAMPRPGSLPPRRNPLTAALHATWAVICLFIGAADALITAALGITPLAGPWARMRAVIADRWRMAYLDAREADVVGEEDTDDVAP